MLKKVAFLFLCAAILFTSGCAAIIEGQYSSSSAHKATYPQASQEAEASAEVTGYAGLYEALKSFVDDGIEYGVIKFSSYSGDIEADLSNACLDVTGNTPMGAYAVYYINYSLNKIVSYYEADISVIYKKTKDEIAKITSVKDRDELTQYLTKAMESRADHMAFSIEQEQITEDTVTSVLEQIYYSHPESILYFPKYSVTCYPEGNYQYILEITMSFPYTTQTASSRLRDLTAVEDTVLESIDADTIDGKVEQLCAYLAENVDYDEDRANSENYSRWYNSYTAYGALILNKAVGEGYAMAMKLMCDTLGIECLVIRGRLNNVNHAWNIIKLENGEYYHVDSTKYISGNRLFFNDSQMQDAYWWDTEAYTACSGGSYYSEGGGAATASASTAPASDTAPAAEPDSETGSGGDAPADTTPAEDAPSNSDT